MEVPAFILGIIIGAVALGTINFYDTERGIAAQELITQCEISLPRDQHCVLVAVKENQDG